MDMPVGDGLTFNEVNKVWTPKYPAVGVWVLLNSGILIIDSGI